MICLTVLLYSVSLATVPTCVPAREEIKFPHAGQYHRVHPSGDQFMYTDQKLAILVDIKNRSAPRIITTQMNAEAYPVESTEGVWDWIAAPIGGGDLSRGTEYFRYSDIRKADQAYVNPVFTDVEHGEYYLSSATLPGSLPSIKKFRTLLYSNLTYRDYELSLSADGSVKSVKKSEKKPLCENIFKPTEIQRLHTPILSKDGQYVGGMANNFLEVYKIDEFGHCTPVAKLPFRGSKVSFSYPISGKAPKITFTSEGGASGKYKRNAYIYDIESKTTQLISKEGDIPYYPGFTKDGRVMYKSENDMIIIDPNQLEGRTENCIRLPLPPKTIRPLDRDSGVR